MAGDERCLVHCDEQDRAGHLVPVADPLLRIERREIGVGVCTAGEAIEHARIDKAWRLRIHTHAIGTGFECDRLGQPLDRMLALGIDRGAAAAFMAECRRDVDDASALLACITRNSCFMLSTVPRTSVSNVAA